MTDHDPFCQCYEPDHWCECDLIARVRADERENGCPAIHAEAVAAQLVEVICEQDEDYRVAIEYMRDVQWHKDQLLDADQACIAALSAEIDRMAGELSSIRMEHKVEIAKVESLIRDKGYQEGYDAAMAAAGEMTGKRIRAQIANDIDAVSLTPSQRQEVVKEFRKVGFDAWLGTPRQSNWPDHIHCIAVQPGGRNDWQEHADLMVKAARDQIANDIDALHSEYDPNGSGDRWHACIDQREHDLLERCAAIARNDVE